MANLATGTRVQKAAHQNKNRTFLDPDFGCGSFLGRFPPCVSEPKLTRKEPKFLSLFAGAGGLDLGLEAAGWNCLYASDIDEAAVATLRANVGRPLGDGRRVFAETVIEQADVTRLSAPILLAKAGVRRGDLDLLAGGPPCQSWSSAGRQLGFDDPRGRLFDDFVRIANGVDARWLLIENVRGLLTARGPDGQPGSALATIRRQLLNAGFQTTVGLLNAADYGVPQRRVRLFLLGFRSGDAPAFPSASHSKSGDALRAPTWATLGQALSGIAPVAGDEIIRPSEKLAPLLETIKPGSGLKSPGKSERTRPGGHWGYRQGCFVADLNQSARTVTANAQQDWVHDPAFGVRRLSPRECAAIQGFPGDWKFIGSPRTQYKLVGNAVPPPLARAIGAALIEQADSTEDSRANLAELLPLPPELAAHIRYTAREEASNGASRRAGIKALRSADLFSSLT